MKEVKEDIHPGEFFNLTKKQLFDLKFKYSNLIVPDGLKGQYHLRAFWTNLATTQKLSEDFMREFQNKLPWYLISSCQKLSEDFIREFQDKVDWETISFRQELSEEFILEFKDKLDLQLVKDYQVNISRDFINKLINEVYNGRIYKRVDNKDDKETRIRFKV